MNLELLEEIHQLQEQEISDTEIASSLGMTKSSMMICLRIEKIVFDKYKKDIEEKYRLKAVNTSFSEQIKDLKADLLEKDKKINSLKSPDLDKYLEEIKSLREELKEERELSKEYYNLLYELDKYENIPNFIKKIFLS